MKQQPEFRDTTTNIALEAARAAVQSIQSHFTTRETSQIKIVGDTEMGLVTKADLAAEKSIVELIQSHYPDHKILSEESFADEISAEHLWIVDPLDGTNNFAHGIPHYSVSIAYCHNGQIQAGVVINGANLEEFTAERGSGAFVNGEPAIVSASESIEEAIIATGFYYDRGQMMRETLQTIESLFTQKIRGIRRFGSAALDLCYVGCGRFTAFFEYRLFPWDFAAGALFVTEAGGQVTNAAGGEIKIQQTTLLASNNLLHNELLATTRKHCHG